VAQEKTASEQTQAGGPTVTVEDITLADMARALAAATGDDSLLNVGIDVTTTLEGDLCLDSLDLAALGAVLRDRYGTTLDLAGYLAGLDIDEIIGLTVGDVAGYVNRCLKPQPET
jgi:acyl carrier protein